MFKRDALFDQLWNLGEIPLLMISRRGGLLEWSPACAAIGSALEVGMSLLQWVVALGGSAELAHQAERGVAAQREVIAVADEQLSVRLIACPSG